MSDNIRLMDRRIRMAMAGTETHRAVVDSVHGSTCTVRMGTVSLSALVAGQTVRAGSVVEVYRPRGIGGQIQVRAVVRY